MRTLGLWSAYKGVAIDRTLCNFPRATRRAYRARYQQVRKVR